MVHLAAVRTLAGDTTAVQQRIRIAGVSALLRGYAVTPDGNPLALPILQTSLGRLRKISVTWGAWFADLNYTGYMAARKRLERDEENDIIKLAKRAGGLALKLKLDGERGFPDRTLLFPGGLAIFIEVKRHAPGSKPSQQQKRWLAKLRALGFTAEIARTASEVEALLAWL